MTFRKGDPRINRQGRPKGSFSLTEILRRELQNVPPEYKSKKKTYAEILIKSILKKGIIDGDAKTQRLIMNYVDGLPTQNLNLGGQKDNPILSRGLSPAELEKLNELINTTDIEEE